MYSQTQTFEPCFSCYYCSSYLAEMTLSIIQFSLICFSTSMARMLSLRKAVLHWIRGERLQMTLEVISEFVFSPYYLFLYYEL